MSEYNTYIRNKYLEIMKNVSPKKNALEQIFTYATLKPGRYHVDTTWNGINQTLEYIVGEPEYDEEVSVLIQHDDNVKISARLTPVSFILLVIDREITEEGYQRPIHTIPIEHLLSSQGRENLDYFLSNALAGYVSEDL